MTGPCRMEVNDLSENSFIRQYLEKHQNSHTLSFSFELDRILSNCETDSMWVMDIVHKGTLACHVPLPGAR